MLEIGDKVKLKPNWLDSEYEGLKLDYWKRNRVIDKLNSFIGIEMIIKRRTRDVFDLDKGEGFAFKSCWLEKVNNNESI